jgi:hypothetical protein
LTPFSSVKKPKPKSEFNPSQMKKSDQMSETKQTSNEIIMQPIREISTVTAQNKRIIRFTGWIDVLFSLFFGFSAHQTNSSGG